MELNPPNTERDSILPFENGAISEAVNAVITRAYDTVRREPVRQLLSDEEIASSGYCEDVTPQITQGIQELIDGTGWSAFIEMHFDSSSPVPQHYFTALAPTQSEHPSEDDIIIDATYLQFIAADARAGLPLCFTGTRRAIVEFMKTHASQEAFAGLYDANSYEAGPSSVMAQDYNLPQRAHR